MAIQSGEQIDRDLMERLGRIVIRWAIVEELCVAFLAFAVSADRAFMRVITQSISNSSVVDWLRVLSEERFADERSRKDLAKLFKIIDEVRSDRNELVHGIWHGGPETHTVLVHTLRMDRAQLVQDKLVTIADLDDLLDHIETLISQLIHLGKHLGFAGERT
ncbi:MAG: hypothetical protein KGJ90_00020 [Patescibacteria group bacterium]|nr:hypothetical protein [Patescibacteria group bacterium]